MTFQKVVFNEELGGGGSVEIICEFSTETGTGEITSNLADEGSSEVWKAACDTLESMILSLACAGVNIDTEQFRTGLSLTLDSMSNELGE